MQRNDKNVNSRLFMAACLGIGISLLLCAPTSAQGDSRTVQDDWAETDLRKAGVQTDEAALIECMRGKDQYLAGLAAYAIAKFPPTPAAVRALNKLVSSDRELTMLFATLTLEKFGNADWVQPALRPVSASR